MKDSFGLNLLLVCILLLGACQTERDKGIVIATVGKQKLTLNELVLQFPQHMRKQLSQAEMRELVLLWINDQVLYQEAEANKIDKIPDLQKEFEKLKKDVVINRFIETALGETINVSDEEIKSYYEVNKETFVLAEEIVNAYHLLFKTQKEANDARQRLGKGESFESIANSIAGDSVSVQEWNLGYFSQGDVIPEISKMLFKMTINTYSYAIKSDFGYHLVQLVDKQKKGEIKRLETVKDEIKQKIVTKKREDKYQRFLLQTKSKFKIQTNFQALSSAVMDSLILVDN